MRSVAIIGGMPVQCSPVVGYGGGVYSKVWCVVCKIASRSEDHGRDVVVMYGDE